MDATQAIRIPLLKRGIEGDLVCRHRLNPPYPPFTRRGATDSIWLTTHYFFFFMECTAAFNFSYSSVCTSFRYWITPTSIALNRVFPGSPTGSALLLLTTEGFSTLSGPSLSAATSCSNRDTRSEIISGLIPVRKSLVFFFPAQGKCRPFACPTLRHLRFARRSSLFVLRSHKPVRCHTTG